MKKLMAIILTLAMVMSLCVVPASAAGSGVTITITPDQSKVDTTTEDAIVTYTVKAKVTDSSLKVGSLTITLAPDAGLTLADKDEDTDSAFYYQENVALKYDKTYNKTGIFGAQFSYAPLTKTFVAVGTTQARNLNSTHGEVVLMTIMGKIAKGTTGSVTLKTTQHSYGDPSGSTASVDCDVTPATVTITKAPITSVSATVSQPVKGHPLDTSVNVGGATAYTATVMWKDVEENMTATGDAKPGKIYTALITLRAKEGEAFSSSLHNTTTPGGYSIEWLNSTELLLTKEFERTQVKGTTGIAIDNTTLTVAVPTAEPGMEQKAELPLTAKVNYDDGTDETVDVSWSIVTDPKPDGVDIEEDGKLTVTNKAAGGEVEVKAAYNGMTDTKTVTITKETLKPSAIVATPPAGGTDITIPNGGTNTSGQCSYKVYDQYGAEMAGTTATWKMDPATVTGVTLTASNGSISVNNTATKGTVKLYAESGGVKSNEITFNIARAASVPTSLTIEGTVGSVNVPTVTEPGTTECAYAAYTAKVKDQYGEAMDGQTIVWSVTENPGVTINNGQLTVTNKADAGTVTITAKSGALTATKTVTINKDVAKATLVEICNQVGEAPETRLLIPAATFTNSEAYTAKVYDQYGVYMPGEMVHWALDPATVAGVELDTVTSSGNAILKVDSTATSGTTFKLKATTATLGTSGVKELPITLTNKTPASVGTAPTAKTDLKYNGNEQKLVTEGTADGGTMQYSLGSSPWSTDIPTAKDAATYTVQYKVVGDSGHTDTAPVTLTVKIDPKVLQSSDLEKSGGSATKVYDGNATSSITVGVKASSLYGTDTLPINGSAVYNSANVNEANTITFTPNAITTGNYTLAATEKLTINNASITPRDLTVTPNAGQSKKFGDADPTLHSTNSGRVTGQIPDFSGALSRAEGEDVGQYDITQGTLALIDHFSSGFKASNYTLKMASPAVKFEITKADAPTLPDITHNQKYNVTTGEKAIGTVMPANAGTLTYAKGTEIKTGSVTVTNWDVDSTGKVTYTLSGGAAGDTVTLPVTIKSTNYADSTVNVVIKLIKGSSGGYYYTPTTAVVPDMPMLYRGCTGDAVKTLQDKLNALGYNSGSVDGIFGAKTYAAVTAFQKANSLGVDGIVGKLTWGKLYGVSPAMPVETTTVVGRPMVSYGSRGDAVRKLQELLNALGYDCGSVDGIFGSKTKAAVLAFQKANGLGVDGIVGPLTWAKLG